MTPAALCPRNHESYTEREKQEDISKVSPGPLRGEKELALQACSAKPLCPLSLHAKAGCRPCLAWGIRNK